MVRRDILINELVTTLPGSVRYLLGKGIQAVACGEPVWGTLGDVARDRGYTEDLRDALRSP
jgi:hypothetical protein